MRYVLIACVCLLGCHEKPLPEALERYEGLVTVRVNCENYPRGLHTISIKVAGDNGFKDEDRFQIWCE